MTTRPKDSSFGHDRFDRSFDRSSRIEVKDLPMPTPPSGANGKGMRPMPGTLSTTSSDDRLNLPDPPVRWDEDSAGTHPNQVLKR